MTLLWRLRLIENHVPAVFLGNRFYGKCSTFVSWGRGSERLISSNLNSNVISFGHSMFLVSNKEVMVMEWHSFYGCTLKEWCSCTCLWWVNAEYICAGFVKTVFANLDCSADLTTISKFIGLTSFFFVVKLQS